MVPDSSSLSWASTEESIRFQSYGGEADWISNHLPDADAEPRVAEPDRFRPAEWSAIGYAGVMFVQRIDYASTSPFIGPHTSQSRMETWAARSSGVIVDQRTVMISAHSIANAAANTGAPDDDDFSGLTRGQNAPRFHVFPALAGDGTQGYSARRDEARREMLRMRIEDLTGVAPGDLNARVKAEDRVLGLVAPGEGLGYPTEEAAQGVGQAWSNPESVLADSSGTVTGFEVSPIAAYACRVHEVFPDGDAAVLACDAKRGTLYLCASEVPWQQCRYASLDPGGDHCHPIGGSDTCRLIALPVSYDIGSLYQQIPIWREEPDAERLPLVTGEILADSRAEGFDGIYVERGATDLIAIVQQGFEWGALSAPEGPPLPGRLTLIGYGGLRAREVFRYEVTVDVPQVASRADPTPNEDWTPRALASGDEGAWLTDLPHAPGFSGGGIVAFRGQYDLAVNHLRLIALHSSGLFEDGSSDCDPSEAREFSSPALFRSDATSGIGCASIEADITGAPAEAAGELTEEGSDVRDFLEERSPSISDGSGDIGRFRDGAVELDRQSMEALRDPLESDAAYAGGDDFCRTSPDLWWCTEDPNDDGQLLYARTRLDCLDRTMVTGLLARRAPIGVPEGQPIPGGYDPSATLSRLGILCSNADIADAQSNGDDAFSSWLLGPLSHVVQIQVGLASSFRPYVPFDTSFPDAWIEGGGYLTGDSLHGVDRMLVAGVGGAPEPVGFPRQRFLSCPPGSALAGIEAELPATSSPDEDFVGRITALECLGRVENESGELESLYFTVEDTVLRFGVPVGPMPSVRVRSRCDGGGVAVGMSIEQRMVHPDGSFAADLTGLRLICARP